MKNKKSDDHYSSGGGAQGLIGRTTIVEELFIFAAFLSVKMVENTKSLQSYPLKMTKLCVEV